MMALPIHRGNPPPSDLEETVELSRQVLKGFPRANLLHHCLHCLPWLARHTGLRLNIV